MSEFSARDWTNGKYCPAHGIPYCTPCFQALVTKSHSVMRDSAQRMDSISEAIARRVAEGNFHRPARRNFFEDRRMQFCLSCRVGAEHHLVLPLEFAISGDDKAAHQLDDTETREVLKLEHLWDINDPEWMKHSVPELDEEDAKLLREFQLFKS